MVILTPSSVLPAPTEEERPPTLHLPYVAGISERIRRVCKDFNIRAVFQVQTHPPSTPYHGQRQGSKCRLRRTMHPRNISEKKRQLETCLKEHKVTCIKGFTDKSAMAKHVWTEHHPIHWNDTRILQCNSRTMVLISREGSNLHTNGTRELQHNQLVDSDVHLTAS